MRRFFIVWPQYLFFVLWPPFWRYVEGLRATRANLQERIRVLEENSMDPNQKRDLERIASEHRAMVEETGAIGIFLRQHYQREIAEGWHANRSLSDIICAYLARERAAAQEKR